MTVDPKLMERLRKLQALAERPGSEEEGQVAAVRLAELMARHQVETADLVDAGAEVGIENGRLDAEEDAESSRVEHWELSLASAVAEVCGGRCWYEQSSRDRRRMRIRMCGPVGSSGAARYMYLWLRRQVADASRAASRLRDESNAWRRAYAVGMVTRVYARMREARRVVVQAATSTALVVVDRQKAAIDAHLESANLRSRQSRDLKRPDARVSGWRDGASVDLGDRDASALTPGPRKLKA